MGGLRERIMRLLALLASLGAWGTEAVHTVPYAPSASSELHAGLVRIESRSGVSGEVRVLAVDDAGRRVEAGRLTLGAGAAVEFEIGALESGDATLDLEATGPGEGDWRLELSTDLDIEARAYARSEGFLTALHDAVLLSGEVELPLFHPGGDARRSVLRLVNAGGEPATVRVEGADDAGQAGGPVTVELGAWEARSYTASELESGSASGLSGSLGDGSGKWRLKLEVQSGSAYATNLLLDGSGVLSSVPGGMSRGFGGVHRVPLFPSASDGAGRGGVVRVVNRSSASAEVSIEAFDATERVYEELRLALGAQSSAEFDSTDLEQGNAAKGLEGSTGPGEGDWWLELTSDSDIEVLSYVETATGPLSAVRGTAGVETAAGMRYEAVLLSGESGELRLLNADGESVEARVSGTDDSGATGGEVRLTLVPWAARTLTATALARGEAGMSGALGAGTGSWRLTVETDGEVDVLSLVRGAEGKLSDVSRRGRPAGAPPRTEVVDATASRADLRVVASASEVELSLGEAFELTATAVNGGGREASATTLRYYRSSDAVIAASDTLLGTAAVAALAPGAASAGSLTLSAPSESGTYYYGACVDAVAEETNTANNCSAAAAVAVTVRERPDLTVEAEPSDSALAPGESFGLEAAVRNRGGADAAPTTLRYYRSSDAVIAASDTLLGTAAVAALAPGAASAGSLTLSAPSESGTYYYGACVDAVAEETNTANNCSAAAAVAVTVRERPDLTVEAEPSDSALAPGESFGLEAAVRNRGGADAAPTTLRYYRSSDAVIAASDTLLGTAAVAALAPGAASAGSLTLSAPSESGTYYYGACVDAVAEETNTANNCSAAAAVAVTVRERPDLTVEAEPSDSALAPGESFGLEAAVRNRGGADAAPTTLRYYRSSDAVIAASDTLLGTAAVAALAPGAASTGSLTLSAPSESGTYYYGACVDAVAEETNTANNCSAAAAVAVTVRERPDLTVEAEPSDSALAPGESFGLEAAVRNRGGADAAPTTLRYYRSSDAVIAASDTLLGTAAVAALAPGAASAGSLTLSAPSESGTYYYGACVDAVAEETNTANNCSAAAAVAVTVRERPDLTVEAEPSDSALAPGESFGLEAAVRNRGGADAAPTTLRYYRSSDAVIAASDTLLGTAAVAALAPGAASAGSLTLSAPSESGTYYYGACVDAVAEETNTANNCSAAAAVAVTVRERPDLTVEAEPSDSALAPGESFGLEAAVRNRGGADAAPTTLRYYRSSDAVIAASDTLLGTAAVAALAPGAASAGSLTLSAPSESGTYYYGACVDAVAEETNTANNCSAAAAVAVTVRERPDLTVEAELSDSALEPWEPFTMEMVVRNLGGADAVPTSLRFYRSVDGTIMRSDFELGRISWPRMERGDTTRTSVDIPAPLQAGTYYYGACVDAVPDESDTTNNCSEALEVTVTEPSRHPDLVVESASVSDDGPGAGENFTLSTTVRNLGDADSGSTVLRYYRSADAVVSTTDEEVGRETVVGLAAAGSSSLSASLAAPSTAGTYYYGACVDAVPDESDTSNNCSIAVTVTAWSSSRYGAYLANLVRAGTIPACRDGYPEAWIAVDYPTESEALAAVVQQCNENSTVPDECESFLTLTGAFTQCAAVAYKVESDESLCEVTVHIASTKSDAEAAGLKYCRDFATCNIVESACNADAL